MLKKIKVSQLHVDYRYQRGEQERQQNKIAKDFDQDLFGIPEVSQRSDGSYWLIDGQQRSAGASLRFGEDFEILCNVHKGLSLQDEAKLYRKFQQERKNLEPVDLYRARLCEEDPIALSVDKVVSSLDLKIARGSTTEGYVQAVNTLLYIAEKDDGESLLYQTLELLKDAWHGLPKAYSKPAIQGIASFLETFPEADRERLVQRLQETTPARIHTAAVGHTSGGSAIRLWIRELVPIYNKNLRSKRLKFNEE